MPPILEAITMDTTVSNTIFGVVPARFGALAPLWPSMPPERIKMPKRGGELGFSKNLSNL
jgi:hypothetical protein